MTYPQVWSNGTVRALPVGRLRDGTLRNVAVGRSVAFRAGPWVEIDEDDSRLLRVTTAAAPAATLFARVDERPVEPAAAELLFEAHPLSRSIDTPEAHPATCATARGPRTRGAWPPVRTRGSASVEADGEQRTERGSREATPRPVLVPSEREARP